MKKFLVASAVVGLLAPVGASAEQRIEVGKTYICTVAAISSDTSICGRVEVPSPAGDLCVRVLAADRLATARVVYNSANEPRCPSGAGLVAGGAGVGGTTGATTAALGGLGATGAIAGVFIAAGLAAAASGGSSNGTN